MGGTPSANGVHGSHDPGHGANDAGLGANGAASDEANGVSLRGKANGVSVPGGPAVGMRRFLGPRVESGRDQPDALLLRRFLQPRPRAAPGERCEFCTEAIRPEHSHVVNIETRELMCSCRGCFLLFTHDGAAGGKYRAVPERSLYDPDFLLSTAQWDTLQIPVRIAFLFHNSALGRAAAFYPSPAGATESLLPLEVWDEIRAANPTLRAMSADVEALLVRRSKTESECYIVPIDRCYELVGLMRQWWKGFDGGEEAHREIDGFFARLRENSERPRPVSQT